MSFTQSSIYQIEIYTPAGTCVADVSPYALSRHFVARRNRAEQIDLTFDQGQLEALATTLGTTVPAILAPGINEVRITRGSRTLVGGKIVYTAATVDERSRQIAVRAVGFLDLFADRYLWPSDTLTYTSTDIGTVAWNFLNQTQGRTNGSFGITRGTIQPSRNVGGTWQPYANSIRDTIIDLTKWLNSIDIEITPTKVFNVYYPGQGTVHSDLKFTYPGNIKRLGLPTDATQLANYAIERGAGNGNAQVIETRADPSSQGIYALRERIEDHPSVNVTATLDTYGDETLRMYGYPTLIPDLTLDGNKEPFLGAYWIGDWVPLSIDAGSTYQALNGQTLRINEIDVTVDENDREDIKLKVGYA